MEIGVFQRKIEKISSSHHSVKHKGTSSHHSVKQDAAGAGSSQQVSGPPAAPTEAPPEVAADDNSGPDFQETENRFLEVWKL